MPGRSVIKANLAWSPTERQIYVRLEVQRIDWLRLLLDSPGQRLEELGR